MNLVAVLDHLRRTARSRLAVALALAGLMLVPLQVTVAGADTSASVKAPTTEEPPAPDDHCVHDGDCPEPEEDPCEGIENLDQAAVDAGCTEEDLVCPPLDVLPDGTCQHEVGGCVHDGNCPVDEPKATPEPSADKPVKAKPTFTG